MIKTIDNDQLEAVLGGCNICIGNCPNATQTDNSHTHTEPTKPEPPPLLPGAST